MLNSILKNSVATIALSVIMTGCAAVGNHAAAQTPTPIAVPVTATSPAQNDGLPNPGFDVVAGTTAIVITDPQNDFLSPNGVTWGVVGKSVTDNNTVENIESLFKVAGETGMKVFVSPHYYYPHDHEWKFEDALEQLMHSIKIGHEAPSYLA